MKKEFQAAFVAALVALSVSGFGQTTSASAGVVTNGITLAMGSTNAVLDYAAKQCNIIDCRLFQNDKYLDFNIERGEFKPDTPTQWVQLIGDTIEYLVQDTLKYGETHTNWVDPDGPFSSYAFVEIGWQKFEPDVPAFFCRLDFSLNKDADGTYRVPTGLRQSLVFLPERSVPVLYAPEGSWARIEVTKRDGQWVADDDNFIQPNDPSNGLIAFDGPYLTVRSLYACSGDSGPYIVKIMMVSNGQYMVFDGNGNQVPETPITLSLQRESGGLKISVTGGDTYRMFSLQKSTDMKNWNTIATGMVPAHSVPWTFTDTSTVGNGFYRVLTVENQALRVALKSTLK